AATIKRGSRITNPAHTADETSTSLEEVVVTGSLIRGVVPAGSSLIMISQGQIAASGATSVEDALATSPTLANFGAPLAGGTNGGESFVPSIHGVGFGATLTLVNGQRLPGAGPLEQFADPSVIPVSAVERIDVMPDGASSIYGSDAVAGVVNVVTRRHFNGLEVGGNYGDGDHYNDSNADIVAGKTWGTGSILFAYEFRDRGPLEALYRNYARADQTANGGGNYTSLNCSPATVQIGSVTYGGPNLTVSPAPGCDNGLTNDLISEQKRHSVFLSVTQALGSRVTASLDAIYSDFTTVQRDNSGQQVGNATITNANPYFIAPPGTGATSELISFNLDREFGSRPIGATTATHTVALMPSLVIDLGDAWEATLNGSFGWESDLLAQNGVDQAVVQTALAGTTASTALNPYGFGPANDPALLTQINDGYQTRNPSTSRLDDLVGKLDGPLVSLPAGEVTAAVGAEARHESSGEESSIGPPGSPVRVSDVSRDVYSAFAELHIPVIGPGQHLPAVRSLALSASGRYDHYTTFGSTTNPKVGISWEPTRGLQLRGSYGTSFQAPSLGDAAPDTVDARVQYLPNYPYPFAPPGEIKNVLLVAGGNPHLKPQTASTRTVGFDLNPSFAPQLSLSATYFTIDYSSLIGEALTATTYTNPAYASFITFNPTPADIAAFTSILPTLNYTPGVPVDILLDARRNNLGSETVGGIDYELGYVLPIGSDKLEAHFAGEYLTKFSQQAVAGAIPQDLLGTDAAVKSKFRATIGWQHRSLDAMIAANYIGKYEDPGVLDMTGSFTTVDLRVAYQFKWQAADLQSTEVSITVQNLFDTAPPFYNSPTGFDQSVASPIGRLVQLGVRVKL
ncbi:MAG TPA: TonB-dependent receptor, partial [Terracidiphilus sp.]